MMIGKLNTFVGNSLFNIHEALQAVLNYQIAVLLGVTNTTTNNYDNVTHETPETTSNCQRVEMLYTITDNWTHETLKAMRDCQIIEILEILHATVESWNIITHETLETMRDSHIIEILQRSSKTGALILTRLYRQCAIAR